MELICNKSIGTHAQKILIVANLIGIDVQVIETSEKQRGVYLKVTEDGVLLPNSVALRYLARMRPDMGLYGETFLEQALVDKSLRFTESTIDNFLDVLTETEKCEGDHMVKIQKDLETGLSEVVENIFLKSTYLVGKRLTIADIDMALALCEAMSLETGPLVSQAYFIKSLPNTKRWLTLILNQPCVQKFYKFEFSNIKNQEQEKKPAAKHADKQKPVKKTAEDHDTDEEATTKQKKINPLDLLPPTSFLMDNWKRVYSNSKDLKGEAMPWFWTQIDQQGWSIWYMIYDKLEEENTQSFFASNMLGGFLQRIEPSLRPYSFGVFNVVGEDKHYDIIGVWLIRGLELPEEITTHPSFEYFKFKKLDFTSPQDKSLLEAYWCNNDNVEGRPICSCQVWK